MKVVVIGHEKTGKSSIVKRFVQDTYDPVYQPTIGASYVSKVLHLSDRQVKFDIWDTAGGRRYRSLLQMYIREAVLIVLVFDVTSRTSFDELPEFMSFKDSCPTSSSFILIGNKADLMGERQVSFEEGSAFANANAMVYLETSALTGSNTEEAFTILGYALSQG
jgi:small GTP-binding protein